MGYTHYWTQTKDITTARWKTVIADIEKIIDYTDVPLADWTGERGVPELSVETFSFNGCNEDSHETFEISRVRHPLEAWQKDAGVKRGWAFCKTAYKPYDKVVVACLCYLADAGILTASSDGGPGDWTEGVELARSALQRPTLQIPEGVKEHA